jgi:hypothetical protein
MTFYQSLDIMRDVAIGLVLEPVYWDDPPDVRIEFNKTVLINNSFTTAQQFNWKLPAEDQNRLSVFFLNKKDQDTVDNLDKAVIIKEISLEGLSYPSFMHCSRYQPDYSTGYYQYAKENNIVVESVIHANYLGFNGEWFFEFTWPTFTWIYETETNGRGWIYEKNI